MITKWLIIFQHVYCNSNKVEKLEYNAILEDCKNNNERIEAQEKKDDNKEISKVVKRKLDIQEKDDILMVNIIDPRHIF